MQEIRHEQNIARIAEDNAIEMGTNTKRKFDPKDEEFLFQVNAFNHNLKH